jgi:hypothetical protein
VPGSINGFIEHPSGVSTATIHLEIVGPDEVENDNMFQLTFKESPTRYSLRDLTPIEEQITIRLDQFVGLLKENIVGESVLVIDENGNEYIQGNDYEILNDLGKIRGIPSGAMLNGQVYTITYTYSPFIDSEHVQSEQLNPIFDGINITVQDVVLALDQSSTGWSSSSRSNWIGDVIPFNGADQFMYPGDYEIRFFDEIADTSSSALHSSFGYSRMNFQVWDVTIGRELAQEEVTIIEEGDSDSLWTPGDRAIIMEGDPLRPKWEFTFFQPEFGDTIPPVNGDVFFIGTHRPFAASDTMIFSTIASDYNSNTAQNELKNISVVPNPYVVTNVLEQLDLQNHQDRGSRKIYFNHLPMQCTISIYTVSGDHVQTLNHDTEMNNGQEHWDLTTKDNFPLAFGVYIYHVNAPGVGEKIGRFAVIK